MVYSVLLPSGDALNRGENDLKSVNQNKKKIKNPSQ